MSLANRVEELENTVSALKGLVEGLAEEIDSANSRMNRLGSDLEIVIEESELDL